MTDLRELYQEVILDHSKRPRNYHRLDSANRSAEGYNPLCGDRIKVYLRVADDTVEDVAFEGSGCAICTASASMMTQQIKGRSAKDAENLFRDFHALVTEEETLGATREDLGKLEVFAGVRDYPVRVKCATLPWHTLHAALDKQDEPVSTE